MASMRLPENKPELPTRNRRFTVSSFGLQRCRKCNPKTCARNTAKDTQRPRSIWTVWGRWACNRLIPAFNYPVFYCGLSSLLDDSFCDHACVAPSPHSTYQRFTWENRFRKPYFDALKFARIIAEHSLHHVTAKVSEGT